MPENVKFEIEFKGEKYPALKGPDGVFIGLVGKASPRKNLKLWNEAIVKAGATLPPDPPSSKPRDKRVADMNEEELAAWRAPSEPRGKVEKPKEAIPSIIKPRPDIERK